MDRHSRPRPAKSIAADELAAAMRILGGLPDLLVAAEATIDPTDYAKLWDEARAATDGSGDLEAVLRVLARIPDALADPGSPRYVGYVPNSASPLGRAVDAHVSVINAVAAGPVDGQGCVVVEAAAADKVAELAGLPAVTRGGTFVQGGTLANFCALAVARETARLRGVIGPGVLLTSAAVHSSVRVAARLLDLKVEAIPVKPNGAVDIDLARARAAELGSELTCVMATAGTTSTGAIDDLRAMAAIAAEHDRWFHVDGAYGGAILFSERRRHLLDGIELCDSFVVDPHKFLFCPYDSSLLVYRDARAVSDDIRIFNQVRDEEAAYLDFGHRHAPVDTSPPFARLELGELALQLSRRARGVVLWAQIAGLGVAEIGRRIDCAIDAVHDVAVYAQRRHVALPIQPTLSVLLLGNDRWTTVEQWDEGWVGPAFAQGYFVSTDEWDEVPVGRMCVVHPDPAPLEVLVDLIADA